MKQGHISRTAEVSVGGTLEIALCSNPSTGFQWSELARIGDQGLVRQTSHKPVAPENGAAPGAPGREEWTFKALNKGETTISLDYSRPWNGGEKGVMICSGVNALLPNIAPPWQHK